MLPLIADRHAGGRPLPGASDWALPFAEAGHHQREGFRRLAERRWARAAQCFALWLAACPDDGFARAWHGIARLLAGDTEAGRVEAVKALVADQALGARVEGLVGVFLKRARERDLVWRLVFGEVRRRRARFLVRPAPVRQVWEGHQTIHLG